jgi:hypothetical protein|tara:strand:- start:860 stop:1177 length:318 start_codon:yes stop_codon:yes gene_type:complete
MADQKTARSFNGAVIDDNFSINLNIKWLGQIIFLAGVLVYGFWTVESRIRNLEEGLLESSKEISLLLEKHSVQEAIKRQELEERVSFYEKEFNINPFSWKKRKKK